MRHKKNAQTITEYLALVTMLGLALAIGWDFIAGGFQGGVKNLSQSVDIASNDPLRRGGGAPQLPFCNCDDDLNNWDCGEEPTIPIPATINCNPRQRYKRKLCTGALCSQAQIEWCEWDNNCCIWLGPDPGGGANHCWDDYCPQPTGLAQGWGNGRYRRQCGNNPIFHQCQGDSICQFSCGWNTVTSSAVGPTPIQGSIPCPNDDFQVPDNAVPWSFVTNGLPSNCSNPQSAIWCERYCPTGTGYNPVTNRCETAVCGDGIKHPTLEYCDPGGGNVIPLPQSQWYNGGGRTILQEQACLDNCQSLGYRYGYRARNFNATASNPTFNPPNYWTYYAAHSGGGDHLYVTCRDGKVVRLHESDPVPVIGGGWWNNMGEGGYQMRCINDQSVLNLCNTQWGQCGYNNSAEGAYTCRLTSYWIGGTNHSIYGFVCQDPTPMHCWATSYHRLWEGTIREPVCSGQVSYVGMTLPASYQAFEGCEGDCGADDGRFKLCCSVNSTPNISGGQCQALSQATGWPTCGAGTTEWIRYQTRDAQTIFCCQNSVTMPNCRTVVNNPVGTGVPVEPLPVCNSNERMMTRWAEHSWAHANVNDSTIAICCQ